MQLLCFELADKEYAVNVDSVREVRRIKGIVPIPKSMEFVEGVVSLRGRVVPIINLRKKLGLPVKDSSLNRVIITESNGHIFGLAVDNVIGVINLDESNIEPPDEILKKAEYLMGVGKVGKRLILIADIKKILSGEDKTGLEALHKKIEVRKKS